MWDGVNRGSLIYCTYSAKSVLRKIQPVDHFETWLKIIYFGISVKNQNTSNEWTSTYKVVETRKGMTKNRDIEQMSWRWSRHRTTSLGRGLASQTVQGISYDNGGYIQKKKVLYS